MSRLQPQTERYCAHRSECAEQTLNRCLSTGTVCGMVDRYAQMLGSRGAGGQGVGEAGAPRGYQSGKGFFIQVWTIASRWRARSSLEAGIVLTRFSSGLNSCATTMTTAEGTRR